MKFKNADRFRRRIAAMAPAARAEIQKALVEGGNEIAGMAKSFAPKKSGDLAASIGVTIGNYVTENANVRGVQATGGGHDLSVTIHAGDGRAFYAAFVEFGTAPHEVGGIFKGAQHPGSRAHPFFFPAFRLGKKRAKSRISRAVNKAAKKAATAS
ncbi:phage protein, HK97 gp10 family [Kaistia soli DSM 19436]|uniref:Phage protein, HK97 gp10 family n=1 Tax=Kaistia soli DSM 19436 TaxID=1122133 RepID=A0A1M4YHU0_9HYPH|nr:HK97-gp10 family putative phage morphogenesis protein [Kaistia soli]SHF05347.1 phage protein, HK97 gp10 family [Kaistia soli DSM 19436]